MITPPLNIDELIRTFAARGISYLVVGGLAAQLYGVKHQVRDFDICVLWERENLNRLGGMLQALDADPMDPLGVVYEDQLIRAMLTKMLIGMWRTTLGDIDVKIGIPSNSRADLKCFGELIEHSIRKEVAGCMIDIVSLDDMIISLQVIRRPKDETLLPALVSLRDTIGFGPELKSVESPR